MAAMIMAILCLRDALAPRPFAKFYVLLLYYFVLKPSLLLYQLMVTLSFNLKVF